MRTGDKTAEKERDGDGDEDAWVYGYKSQLPRRKGCSC